MATVLVGTSGVCFGAASGIDDDHPLFNLYPTRFGVLKFVDDKGSLNGDSTRVILDGKEILQVDRSGDGYGYSLSLIPAGLTGGNAVDLAPRKGGASVGKADTKRIVIIEGRSFDCAKQLILIDLTTKKPYVSNRFGINRGGKGCLSFKDAKWGKNESYIYLNQGTLKYYYPTGGKVIGPVD